MHPAAGWVLEETQVGLVSSCLEGLGYLERPLQNSPHLKMLKVEKQK